MACCIRPFGADPRGLPDIPEVRAVCRRIRDLGFIAGLDGSTTLVPGLPEVARQAEGAAEVWRCAEGRWQPGAPATRPLRSDLQEAVGRANARADRLLGPLPSGEQPGCSGRGPDSAVSPCSHRPRGPGRSASAAPGRAGPGAGACPGSAAVQAALE
jgi:hypothetical protein